jgi:hypothetical protein
MPSTRACPEENKLLALAMGESAADAVTCHVNGCTSCQTKLTRLRAEVAILRANQSQMALSPSTCHSAASGATASWELDDLAGDRALLPPTGTVDDDAGSRSDEPPLPRAIARNLVVGRFPPIGRAEIFRVVHSQIQQERVLKLAKQSVGVDSRSDIVEEGTRP